MLSFEVLSDASAVQNTILADYETDSHKLVHTLEPDDTPQSVYLCDIDDQGADAGSRHLGDGTPRVLTRRKQCKVKSRSRRERSDIGEHQTAASLI